MSVENNIRDWFDVSFNLAINAASHPFQYAKVLMQLGHEPLGPFPTKTMFANPAMCLPNVIDYVKYIYAADGLKGCYRGLGARLLADSVNLITCKSVSDSSSSYFHELISSSPENEYSQTNKWITLCRDLLIQLSGKVAGVVASHPFNVITLRIMAQFIGGENYYSGIFPSIAEIYNTDGITGFFNGLIPRLLGEVLFTVFFNVGMFIAKNNIRNSIHERLSRSAIKATGKILKHPFEVVSACMAVNNCGLAAGIPCKMPIYPTWVDCWSHLSESKQLMRGYSMFYRYYRGQYIYSTADHRNILMKKVLKVFDSSFNYFARL